MNGFSFGMAVAREGGGFFVSLGWYKPWYKIILTPRLMNFANLIKVVKFDHFNALYNPAP